MQISLMIHSKILIDSRPIMSALAGVYGLEQIPTNTIERVEVVYMYVYICGVSLVAQLVKNLPAVPETQVRSLDREDPLEKKMATHCSILPWIIPWTEDPGRLPYMELQRVRHD